MNIVTEEILAVKNLKVWLKTAAEPIRAVDTVSFTIYRGETLALVGESGSGKSMTALALMRLLPNNAMLFEGSEVKLQGVNLSNISEAEMSVVRRQELAIIFQDPMMALNPIMTIGAQIVEALPVQRHDKKRAKKEGLDWLKRVKMPDAERLWDSYPHQLSGGMRQRVMIAIAIGKRPKLLIADEPTTSLDVTIQAQVIMLMQELQAQYGTSILLITHNLGVVAQLATRVSVMYAGHIIEENNTQDLLRGPKHPYTQKLLASLPEQGKRGQFLPFIPGLVPTLKQPFRRCRFYERCHTLLPACESHLPDKNPVNTGMARCHWYASHAPALHTMLSPLNTQSIRAYDSLVPGEQLLDLQDLKIHFPIYKGLWKRKVGVVKAVDGVHCTLEEDETLAIVGESGCGKTSLARGIMQLLPIESGTVSYLGQNLNQLSAQALKKERQHFQMIFQDPYSSLDPKMPVGVSLSEGLRIFNIGSDRAERTDRIDHLLLQVGLPIDSKYLYPHEFSGGQRQRLCIARALSVGPRWLICDEPTSALDISVQAQVLNLLQSLQNEYNISYIFITHDISLVRYMADRVAVLYLGRIVEQGPATSVCEKPLHPYTQLLMASVPSVFHPLPMTEVLAGEIASPMEPPTGCHYHPRCPHAMDICRTTYPPITQVGDTKVACYLYVIASP